MIRKVVRAAVVTMVVLNASEVAFLLAIRGHGNLYPTGKQLPLPSGYLLDRRFKGPCAAPCYLVRLSARGCRFCRLDEARYARLLGRAREAGCETIVIAPIASVAESFEDRGIVQLQYLDMTLGRALNPFITPQSILLDGRGRVLWSAWGAMDERGLREALHALDALH